MVKTKSHSLREYIVNKIASRIISGYYKEGELLPREVDLCKEFNISRSSIREALRSLAHFGFVNAVSGVGTRIRPYNEWNLLNDTVLSLLAPSEELCLKLASSILDLRETLEPHVAKLAAKNSTPSNLLEIEIALNNMKNHINNINQYTIYDAHFHAAIFRSTGNPLWSQISHFIFSALTNVLNMSNSRISLTSLQNALQKHEELYQAILRRDEIKAQKLSSSLISEAIAILKL